MLKLEKKYQKFLQSTLVRINAAELQFNVSSLLVQCQFNASSMLVQRQFNAISTLVFYQFNACNCPVNLGCQKNGVCLTIVCSSAQCIPSFSTSHEETSQGSYYMAELKLLSSSAFDIIVSLNLTILPSFSLQIPITVEPLQLLYTFSHPYSTLDDEGTTITYHATTLYQEGSPKLKIGILKKPKLDFMPDLNSNFFKC